MYIITQFLDDLVYRRDPDHGNCLRLTKHI
jgi:hypothetical protein